MASTVTIESGGRSVAFPQKIRRGTLTLGTYATNGVAVAGSQFELYNQLSDLRVDPSSGYVPVWDKTNAKIKVYRQKDPAAAGGADIALPEVANAVDLSSITFRFRAEGR